MSLLSKQQIESRLADYFGRKFCCLTNRGTTALTAALHALGKPAGATTLFPAVMCSIPVFSAKFAGGRPEFADVDLTDGNFSLPDVDRVLAERAGEVGAVVPVHMFGQPEKMEELQTLCDKHGAALIEDGALSMGARHKGRPVGRFGAMSCLSFVRKMLPLEMGGAVLTDDTLLNKRVRAFVEDLPPPPPNQRERTEAAMKEFHTLTGRVAANGWKDTALFRPYEKTFAELFLSRTVEEDWKDSVVLDELAALEDVVKARRARAEVYETVLTHPRLPSLEHGESCFFAYPVRLTDVGVESFLEFADAEGFSYRRIAYPDVHKVFGSSRPDGAFPNARILEKELMGLAVDDDQPVSSFWEYAQDFLKIFERYLEEGTWRAPDSWEGKLERRMGT
ncbi:MAG TPA: DegT/DnrJ/EryC1/StrS family aminotransferase [Elusimicrobiota bacterium]|nr:DegT/DnrJ/EryC1/StrS family aminotransferase [Elusimicrobiota bacterium]